MSLQDPVLGVERAWEFQPEATHVLPFNIGHDGGAGNPPGAEGRSATAYLWERVWEKNAWLTIIGRLMIVETREEWDVTAGTSVRRASMLFPRFHQWEGVTTIVDAVREEGVGNRYLIEHSAGSGKTNTIVWTAHRLARLHVDDEKVFDSVIVVVDRTVLDGQLQEPLTPDHRRRWEAGRWWCRFSPALV
nr:DEAD/DEAH box helicase family protein [Frankia sp. Cj5]